MARPLRLQFPGSIWHVTARGNERKDIVTDDADRRLLLSLLGRAAERFDWAVFQYVFMTNHYHFVLQLAKETLSSGMHWLNATYAQAFNRRHDRVGHLFQGRFHATLVEKESYLLEVLRYVALNPVRAHLVARPEGYEWSGHRALAGYCAPPAWLATDQALSCFAPEPVVGSGRYREFVDGGIGITRSPWEDVVGQIYLGTDTWVEAVRERIASRPRSDEFPHAQRVPVAPSMSDVIAAVASGADIPERSIRFERGGRARMLAAWVGYHRVGLDLRAIAAGLRVRSTGGISKLIRTCDRLLQNDAELQSMADRSTAALRRV